MKRNNFTHIALVFFLLLILTIPFWVTDYELKISDFFWKNERWFYKDFFIWSFLYHYGNIPALLLSAGSLLLLSYSFIKNKLIKYRKILLFFILTMLIGPGIIVNLIFKEHWGRYRPREIVQFNGEHPYLKPWVKGKSGSGKSFPCGHASVGFYLIVPYWVLRKKYPESAKTFLFGGIGYGTLIGVARIAQGGHFAGDVLWSGGMIYLASYTVSSFMKLDENIYYEENKKKKNKKNKPLGIIIASVSILTLGLFLLASPFYKIKKRSFSREILSSEGTVEILIDADAFEILSGDSLEIIWTAQGFGLPGCKVKEKRDFQLNKNKKYSACEKGFFSELTVDAIVKISPDYLRKTIVSYKDSNAVIKSEFPFEIKKSEDLNLIKFNQINSARQFFPEE
ncbi:MAG: hypothetical protein CSB55_00555 [Candidatus Cloacimonadota bacterium]|nr:MAG: hypothetical protein CSB55_00555 [Candidatus Cloacimonadota bacterium]